MESNKQKERKVIILLIKQSISMKDGRINNGGIREGAGRKSKAEEQNLIEKLTPLDPIAFKALKNAIEDEQSWAVKLYFDYKFGKPRETKDINMAGDMIIDLSSWE